MTTTSKNLVDYKPATYPTLGSTDRYIANELDKIARSLASIIALLRATS